MEDLERSIIKGHEVRKVKLMKTGPANSTIFILGATGTGKSTLVGNLLLERKRFVIFDTRNEYDPNFFDAQTRIATSPYEVGQMLNNEVDRIIFKVPATDDDTEFDTALGYIYQFQQVNSSHLPPITVSIDELNRFVESGSWPHYLKEIVQRGRDYKIEKILGAQWFGTIPTWMRDSLSEIYAYRHNDQAGLTRLEVFGFPSEELRELPQYTVMHLSHGEIKTVKLVI